MTLGCRTKLVPGRDSAEEPVTESDAVHAPERALEAAEDERTVSA
jgi:hypothetical protein